MRQTRLAATLMLGLAAATMPVMRAHAQLAIVITIAPPVLPVYEQPPIPEPGYIWAPGYWAYSDAGYYWVPGTWVLPPQPGLLWTPGYWGYGEGGAYAWHAGYWGPHVGFYGGVNYGYGYNGNGYEGGYWQHNQFYYNRNVNNFGDTHITNVYEHNVTNVTVNRISYNGGHGGIDARPNQQQLAYQNEHHFDPTPGQQQQQHLAAGNRDLWASQNHGVPPIAATPRPADFAAHGAVPAHNAPVQAPPQHAANQMQPQHPTNMGTPHVVEPGNTGMNHPENVPHTQPGPQAFHPQEVAPAQHEPAPQAYHPQQMAPVQHEPAPQAYHPQEMQAPHQQEAPHPATLQAPHPQEMHPQGAPHPEGGGQHPPGGEHKPN